MATSTHSVECSYKDLRSGDSSEPIKVVEVPRGNPGHACVQQCGYLSYDPQTIVQMALYALEHKASMGLDYTLGVNASDIDVHAFKYRVESEYTPVENVRLICTANCQTSIVYVRLQFVQPEARLVLELATTVYTNLNVPRGRYIPLVPEAAREASVNVIASDVFGVSEQNRMLKETSMCRVFCGKFPKRIKEEIIPKLREIGAVVDDSAAIYV